MLREKSSVGRATADFQAKLLGRQPLRYHFEIIPQSVEGLATGSDQVSVVWEKGAKISYTDPSSVDANGEAQFSQIMRQTATIYRQDATLLPKEYSFKVQTVKQSAKSLLASSETRRKTIARAKLNLAQFCTPGVAAPATAEVALQLQPQGLLRLGVRAVWLQHYNRPQAGRTSDTGSITDFSSHHSSESESLDGDAGDGTVDRTASIDMDHLTDYATAHAPRQTAGLSSAATAHCNAPGSASPAATGVRAPTAAAAAGASSQAPYAAGSNLSFTPSVAAGAAAGGHGCHKRTISLPEHDIHPIQEAEREGLEASLSLERSASGHHSAVAAAVAAATSDATLGNEQLLTTAASEGVEAEGLRSLSNHLPSWLWPFSRDAVRGATTDQLMREIAAAEDVGKLQQLCRGLLCERNDWRYKAAQLDRNVQSLQHQVQSLQQANGNLAQQLQVVESQVGQLQQDSLVDKLVEAKLQLAQADLSATALKGQLNKERERARQWAAKFTTLQVMYESLLEQEAAREGGYSLGAICTTPDGTSRRSSMDAGTSGGDQGEGLSAITQGAAGVVRKLSSSGWGGFWAGGTAGAAATAAGGGAAAAASFSRQQSSAGQQRRLSSPSGVDSAGDVPGVNAAGVEQQKRPPRHSIA